MSLLVVLDFDGTFTDVEAEGAPFVAHYKAELAGLLGRDIERLWADAETGLANPETGWSINGQIVAPANADPYIRATVIAFAICDRLDILPNLEVRTNVLQVLYAYCYRFTKTVFRPDAKPTLDRLGKAGALLRVVTNSDPDVVKKKLESIGVTNVPVIGNARKFFVDPTDPNVADLPNIRVEGLNRPLMTKRPNYRRVLDELWRTTGTTPASTLVCGDIFELDLALPLVLGTMGHLLVRPNTLPYELTALARHAPRATSSVQLEGLAERVESWVAATP